MFLELQKVRQEIKELQKERATVAQNAVVGAAGGQA